MSYPRTLTSLKLVKERSMSDFASLSYRQQTGRLRRLATAALETYPLKVQKLQLVTHRENTTFRLVATGHNSADQRYMPDHHLLRIHRPGKHGPARTAERAILSELEWLSALRRDTGLAVPDPVSNRQALLTTVAETDGVPEPRVVSVLRWLPGRRAGKVRPVHLARLGSAMALLHEHADRWQRPEGFTRRTWDWDMLFGHRMDFGAVTAAEAFELVPADHQSTFRRVAEHARGVMQGLGHGADVFGLIHADLHLDNVVFWRSAPQVIDFDDCGFGHRMYDVAVALWEHRTAADFPSLQSAFVAGYEQHRPLRPEHMALLDSFIAAREVTIGLWLVGMAQANPSFREGLSDELAFTADVVRNKLDLPDVWP